MLSIFTGVLISAFQSVLTDEDFDLPSQPAIAARKGAEQFLASYATGSRQKREIESFAHTLTYTLQACFNNIKGSKSRKERICEQFYHTRCTADFAKNWEACLKVCGVDAIPTLYQHITDKVFNHLLKVNCPIKPTAEATQSQLLDYNEKNALRYVAGYVTRKIYRKLKNSKNLMKDELLLCLAEINDVDPNEMLSKTQVLFIGVANTELTTINCYN